MITIMYVRGFQIVKNINEVWLKYCSDLTKSDIFKPPTFIRHSPSLTYLYLQFNLIPRIRIDS